MTIIWFILGVYVEAAFCAFFYIAQFISPHISTVLTLYAWSHSAQVVS